MARVRRPRLEPGMGKLARILPLMRCVRPHVGTVLAEERSVTAEGHEQRVYHDIGGSDTKTSWTARFGPPLMKQTGPTNYTFTFAGTAMTYHEDKDGRFVMDAEEHARLQEAIESGAFSIDKIQESQSGA